MTDENDNLEPKKSIFTDGVVIFIVGAILITSIWYFGISSPGTKSPQIQSDFDNILSQSNKLIDSCNRLRDINESISTSMAHLKDMGVIVGTGATGVCNIGYRVTGKNSTHTDYAEEQQSN